MNLNPRNWSIRSTCLSAWFSIFTWVPFLTRAVQCHEIWRSPMKSPSNPDKTPIIPKFPWNHYKIPSKPIKSPWNHFKNPVKFHEIPIKSSMYRVFLSFFQLRPRPNTWWTTPPGPWPSSPQWSDCWPCRNFQLRRTRIGRFFFGSSSGMGPWGHGSKPW